MNKKEFETELLTLCDKYDVEADEMGVRFFHDVWQWIEQYGEEQRIVGKENALFSLLELPSIIDVPHIVYIIENIIKFRFHI